MPMPALVSSMPMPSYVCRQVIVNTVHSKTRSAFFRSFLKGGENIAIQQRKATTTIHHNSIITKHLALFAVYVEEMHKKLLLLSLLGNSHQLTWIQIFLKSMLLQAGQLH
jgi:hypothetical protein